MNEQYTWRYVHIIDSKKEWSANTPNNTVYLKWFMGSERSQFQKAT